MIQQTIITILLFLCSTFGFSQSGYPPSKHSTDTSFQLEWKIEPSDTLIYETVMTEIGESNFDIDFKELFSQLSDTIDVDRINFDEDLMEKLKNIRANTNISSQLTASEDFENVIKIELSAAPNETGITEHNFGLISKGVMLRGSIYKTGGLHSFWIKRSQKNLIALFYVLPSRAVKKGDSWTLDNVNFIGNDHSFDCREAKSKNVLTVADIKQVDDDYIVVIDYDILEYVSGEFSMPANFENKSENKKTTMHVVYKAQAEFSIKQGKWLSYNGIMSINSSGWMNTNQKQKFALIER